MGSVHWRCKEDLAWRPRGPSCRPPAWGRSRTGRPGWRGPGPGTRGDEGLPLRGWRAPGLRGLAGRRGGRGGETEGGSSLQMGDMLEPDTDMLGEVAGELSVSGGAGGVARNAKEGTLAEI